jgi:hypothetical protein
VGHKVGFVVQQVGERITIRQAIKMETIKAGYHVIGSGVPPKNKSPGKKKSETWQS